MFSKIRLTIGTLSLGTLLYYLIMQMIAKGVGPTPAAQIATTVHFYDQVGYGMAGSKHDG